MQPQTLTNPYNHSLPTHPHTSANIKIYFKNITCEKEEIRILKTVSCLKLKYKNVDSKYQDNAI